MAHFYKKLDIGQNEQLIKMKQVSSTKRIKTWLDGIKQIHNIKKFKKEASNGPLKKILYFKSHYRMKQQIENAFFLP